MTASPSRTVPAGGVVACEAEISPCGGDVASGAGLQADPFAGPPHDHSVAAELPSLRRFAQHLERDLDAVTAGLSHPWNSGVVEGRVNRIKMLKRQMFGRAGFELLRKRVLLT